MDPFSLIIGAGIAAVSFIGGRLSKRRTTSPIGTTSTKPVCTCRHGLAFHDPNTNECHATVNDQPSEYSEFTGRPIAWTKVRCSCRQYVGPIPADQMLASFNPPPRAMNAGSGEETSEGDHY